MKIFLNLLLCLSPFIISSMENFEKTDRNNSASYDTVEIDAQMKRAHVKQIVWFNSLDLAAPDETTGTCIAAASKEEFFAMNSKLSSVDSYMLITEIKCTAQHAGKPCNLAVLTSFTNNPFTIHEDGKIACYTADDDSNPRATLCTYLVTSLLNSIKDSIICHNSHGELIFNPQLGHYQLWFAIPKDNNNLEDISFLSLLSEQGYEALSKLQSEETVETNKLVESLVLSPYIDKNISKKNRNCCLIF